MIRNNTVGYFNAKQVAGRYHEFRPRFHEIIKERIVDNCAAHFVNALDVACGTGHTTVILQTIADTITGIDISAEMIAAADKSDKIKYLVSPAETLPFDSNTFNLITVGSAFHWFDKERFLSEVRRVLRKNGFLVIYNNSFTGRMKDNEEFLACMRSLYNEYPAPRRDSRSMEELFPETYNLNNFKNEEFENESVFTKDEFVHYLTTQSNFIDKIENGSISFDALYDDLASRFGDFFDNGRRSLVFKNEISYLKTII